MNITTDTLQPTGEAVGLLLDEQQQLIDDALAALADDAGAILEPHVLDAVKTARQDPATFARIRQKVKQAGSVPMGEFDRLTQPGEDEAASSEVMFEEVTPWSKAVDGAELITDIQRQFSRFVVADTETLQGAALWAVFTWCHERAQVSPLAHISAPEKRCGKTVLLECLSGVVSRPMPASSISSASLFRVVERWQPCLLIDEADSFMADAEDMRGLINSGFNKSSAFVIRCVGDNHEPTRFTTFAPKVLCGIGKLAGTIMDRSIPLRMRRKLAGERTERIRHSDPAEWETLRRKLARWGADNAEAVHQSRPADIAGLNDRANDAWEPLQQIAAVAGGDWPTIARNAAIALHGVEDEAPSVNVELLADIKAVFDNRSARRIFTADLLEALLEDEEAPWVSWNRGKPITARQISKRLADFNIKSQTIRVGGATRKGYKLEQFQDAFERYLATAPRSLSVTSSHPLQDKGFSGFPSVTPSNNVTNTKRPNPLVHKGCDDVTDRTPPRAANNTEVF